MNKKEYGKAEVQTNWGKAICLRIEGLAKTVWIPKSSFKILEEEPSKNGSWREVTHYTIEANEWWRNQYPWLFR